MYTPKIGAKNKAQITFGPCRLSYTHLFEKYTPDGADERSAKYMTNVLIPKTEKETISAIKEAITAAKDSAIIATWGGKEPRKLAVCLRDGDDKDDPLYHGHYYINAKCSTRPPIVDKDRIPIVDEEEIYSGVWASVSVSFYGYDVSGNKGIAAGLNSVMKYKDDERLGGRNSVEADFEGFGEEEDENDF